MLKTISIVCIMLAAITSSAFAQSDCAEPIAPAAVDGSKATVKQISEAAHDANQFMKQSDDYQSCLTQDLHRKQAAAAKEKKDLDPAVADQINAAIDENQKMKEKIGAEFQAAFAAFCKANPSADPSCKKVLGQ